MTFGLLLTLIVFLIHAYLWVRLVRTPQLPRVGSALATCLLGLCAVSVPLAVFSQQRWGARAPGLSQFGYLWLGLTFYLFLFTLAGEGVRVILALRRWLGLAPGQVSSAPQQARPSAVQDATASGSSTTDVSTGLSPNGGRVAPVTDKAGKQAPVHAEERRVFLARNAATAAVLATGGLGLYGGYAARWHITRPEVQVQLARLPKALEGYTIALMSDIHIGAQLDRRFLRHLVEQCNAARPDLVAIVGDMVDGSVADLGPHIMELTHLNARQGVFFVTGNHEYYSGAPEWIAFLRSIGVNVLENTYLSVGDKSPGGAQFDIAGVTDHLAHRFRGPQADAGAATVGRDPERELIMLAHQPIQIYDVLRSGAGLQLSGHTHGGQLSPANMLVSLVQPYTHGLHAHPGSDTQVYVSRGTGFWGPPMRVLAPAEITLLRLVTG